MSSIEPPTPNHANGQVWRPVFATIEGRILGIGLGLAAFALLTTAIMALWRPDLSGLIASMAVANLVLGRAMGLSIGYAAGHGHLLVIGVNMLTEAILVLLVYPVFVLSLSMLPMPPRLRGLLTRTHQAALRHQDAVSRYGVIGLFVFVWIPFWMTGAVVGAAIGYLIGLRSLVTLGAVLSGTFLAVLAWAWLIHSLHLQAATFGLWGTLLLLALILALALLGYWLSRRREAAAGADRTPFDD